MLLLEMDGRWNTYGFKLLYLALVIILYDVHGCTSLNSEGLALLELRSKVNCDPHGILANWNPDHCDPCKWSRVQCLAGKVQMLDLHGHSLEGRLTPELGNLTHLRSIIFHGSLIPSKTVDSFIRPLKETLLRYLTISRAARTIGPWKTSLSGQLQKAFVTGVPKLNRSELETACEDFSNIISSHDAYKIYKGTLSSGVEIAVASTTLSSLKDWSESSEMAFRKKIDTLSRVNHKNFVNLIGYCEEDEPFTRMMVFEYAPNGTLYEHLHVKETDPLDWSARMRAIMGTTYCLQYMHFLNPPVPHSGLNSNAILLTDDYAAKRLQRLVSAQI